MLINESNTDFLCFLSQCHGMFCFYPCFQTLMNVPRGEITVTSVRFVSIPLALITAIAISQVTRIMAACV